MTMKGVLAAPARALRLMRSRLGDVLHGARQGEAAQRHQPRVQPQPAGAQGHLAGAGSTKCLQLYSFEPRCRCGKST